MYIGLFVFLSSLLPSFSLSLFHLLPSPPPHRILHSCERLSTDHLSDKLLHLLSDLCHYFQLSPRDTLTHDAWQQEVCILRERQELFQKQGVLILILSVITETGGMCRKKCDSVTIKVHHILYQLLAAMIRGSRKNCSEFATEKWLNVFIDQLKMPAFTHDVLEVIQCLLTDSPEVLNIISESHIQARKREECACTCTLLR